MAIELAEYTKLCVCSPGFLSAPGVHPSLSHIHRGPSEGQAPRSRCSVTAPSLTELHLGRGSTWKREQMPTEEVSDLLPPNEGLRGCLLGDSKGSCIHGDPLSRGPRPSCARPSLSLPGLVLGTVTPSCLVAELSSLSLELHRVRKKEEQEDSACDLPPGDTRGHTEQPIRETQNHSGPHGSSKESKLSSQTWQSKSMKVLEPKGPRFESSTSPVSSWAGFVTS